MKKQLDAATLAARIAQGGGGLPADLVIKDVRLFDLVTGDAHADRHRNLRRRGRRHLCARIAAQATIDGRGRIAVPGFIDTHLHVESSLVTPLEFDRCVLPHGVTTAICDPHEMANVIGTAAFDYFLACAERTVMDLRVQAVELRAGDPSRDVGRRHRCGRPCALSRPPEGRSALPSS